MCNWGWVTVLLCRVAECHYSGVCNVLKSMKKQLGLSELSVIVDVHCRGVSINRHFYKTEIHKIITITCGTKPWYYKTNFKNLVFYKINAKIILCTAPLLIVKNPMFHFKVFRVFNSDILRCSTPATCFLMIGMYIQWTCVQSTCNFTLLCTCSILSLCF